MRNQYDSIPVPHCEHSGQLAKWLCVSPGCTKVPFICRNCEDDKCMSDHQHGGDVRLRNWQSIMDGIHKAKDKPQDQQLMAHAEQSYTSLLKRLEQLYNRFTEKIKHLYKVSKQFQKLKLLEDLKNRDYKDITGEKIRSFLGQNTNIEDQHIKEECNTFLSMMKEMGDTMDEQLRKIQNRRKSQELRMSATNLINEEKYDEAEELLNKIIEQHRSPENLQLRVQFNLKLQKYEQALIDLEEITKLNPKMHKAFYYKGLIFLKRYELQKAYQSFTSAINGSNDVPAKYNEKRGNVLYEMEKYENALTDYSDVLMKRQTPWDYLNRSATLSKLNLKGAAEKDCEMAFKMMEEGEYYEVQPYQSYAYNKLEGVASRADKLILFD